MLCCEFYFEVLTIYSQFTCIFYNCSEDELLYTVPSSSPLPFISNSFGNDVSSCLHEISTSDQSWALSGHISGPTNVFCNKVMSFPCILSC